MDSWTSKDNVYRDLTRAQGGVPLAIPDPLNFYERLPEDYEKEKEEHNLCDGNAAADFSQGPDVHMIRSMLDMVNAYDESETESNTNRNRDPFSAEFVPKDSTSTVVTTSITKKMNRNAAIESILKAQESNLNVIVNKYIPPPLRNKLKTEDQTTEKKQKSGPTVFNSNIGSSMFKRKLSKKSDKDPVIQSKEPQEVLKTKTFIPSTLANSYYEKFIEFNETKKVSNFDVWSVIEHQLKCHERKQSTAMENTSSTEINICDGSYIHQNFPIGVASLTPLLEIGESQ